MQDEVDYYDLLDIKPEASDSEVKAAYRRAVRAAHPDARGTAGMFRAVHTAYRVLSDPEQRLNYDRGRAHGAPGVGPDKAPEPEPDYVVEEWPPPAGDQNAPPGADYRQGVAAT